MVWYYILLVTLAFKRRTEESNATYITTIYLSLQKNITGEFVKLKNSFSFYLQQQKISWHLTKILLYILLLDKVSAA